MYAIIIWSLIIQFWFVQNVRDQVILDKFANRLKKLRKDKNMTQEQLSYKSGLTLSQIARIETGRLNSSICTVVTLAKALEKDPSELLKFD